MADKSFSPISLLWYGIAIIFPVVFCVILTDNINETQPAIPFVMCTLLMFVAGLLSFPGPLAGDKLKWVALSVFFGLAEAAGLVFLV